MSEASREPLRPFYLVRAWLKADADGKPLTLLDRFILHELAGYMDSDGTNGYPGNETLAGITNTDPDSVKRSLRRLRKLKLIVGTIKRPKIGEAQNWKLSDSFARRLRDFERKPEKRGTGESPSTSERGTGESEEGDPGAGRGGPGSPPTGITDNTGVDGDELQDVDAVGDLEAAVVDCDELGHDFTAGGGGLDYLWCSRVGCREKIPADEGAA